MKLLIFFIVLFMLEYMNGNRPTPPGPTPTQDYKFISKLKAEWEEDNVIYNEGYVLFEKDTKRFKFADGVNVYRNIKFNPSLIDCGDE